MEYGLREYWKREYVGSIWMGVLEEVWLRFAFKLVPAPKARLAAGPSRDTLKSRNQREHGMMGGDMVRGGPQSLGDPAPGTSGVGEGAHSRRF